MVKGACCSEGIVTSVYMDFAFAVMLDSCFLSSEPQTPGYPSGSLGPHLIGAVTMDQHYVANLTWLLCVFRPKLGKPMLRPVGEMKSLKPNPSNSYSALTPASPPRGFGLVEHTFALLAPGNGSSRCRV